jgi:hypothetical protein
MPSPIAAVVLAGVLFGSTLGVAGAQSPGEAVAAEIRKHLPEGWTCTLIAETGKMGHPHGLEEPLFRLDFVNPTVAFTVDETKRVHPNLRLHFHPSAERARILRTIEAERFFSWAIPVLFADTRDYVVVTSPLWQNHYTEQVGTATWGVGVSTSEAVLLIAPLLQVLKKYLAGSAPVATPSGKRTPHSSSTEPSRMCPTSTPGGLRSIQARAHHRVQLAANLADCVSVSTLQRDPVIEFQ